MLIGDTWSSRFQCLLSIGKFLSVLWPSLVVCIPSNSRLRISTLSTITSAFGKLDTANSYASLSALVSIRLIACLLLSASKKLSLLFTSFHANKSIMLSVSTSAHRQHAMFFFAFGFVFFFVSPEIFFAVSFFVFLSESSNSVLISRGLSKSGTNSFTVYKPNVRISSQLRVLSQRSISAIRNFWTAISLILKVLDRAAVSIYNDCCPKNFLKVSVSCLFPYTKVEKSCIRVFLHFEHCQRIRRIYSFTGSTLSSIWR